MSADGTDDGNLWKSAGQFLGLVKKDKPSEADSPKPAVDPKILERGQSQETADPPINAQLVKTILVEAMGDEAGVLARFMGVLEELQVDSMDELQRIRVALKACGAKVADISQGLRDAKDVSLPKQERAFQVSTVHEDTVELERLTAALQEKRAQVQSLETQIAELQSRLETLRKEVLQDESTIGGMRETAQAKAKEFSQALGSAKNQIASLLGQLTQIR